MTNHQFLEKVVQTLIDTVIDATHAQCKSRRSIVPFDVDPDGTYFYEDKLNSNNNLPEIENFVSQHDASMAPLLNELLLEKKPETDTVLIERTEAKPSKADLGKPPTISLSREGEQPSRKRPSSWSSSTKSSQATGPHPGQSESPKVTLKDETKISEALLSNSLLESDQSFEEYAERRNFPEDLLALKKAHSQMHNMKVRPLPGSSPYLGPNQPRNQGGIPRLQGYIRNKKAYYSNPEPQSNGYTRYLVNPMFQSNYIPYVYPMYSVPMVPIRTFHVTSRYLPYYGWKMNHVPREINCFCVC